ncbi:MAG: hypothetical protein MUF49_08885 [Oculatellaceae cyanobacterium Prado106]|jgi:hypothetical protein|nr:hypothetical protein [Oculatellaceae cyanobacterium Prado106]
MQEIFKTQRNELGWGFFFAFVQEIFKHKGMNWGGAFSLLCWTQIFVTDVGYRIGESGDRPSLQECIDETLDQPKALNQTPNHPTDDSYPVQHLDNA